MSCITSSLFTMRDELVKQRDELINSHGSEMKKYMEVDKILQGHLKTVSEINGDPVDATDEDEAGVSANRYSHL